MTASGFAAANTIRHSSSACAGGATGSDAISVLVTIQYLGWDLQWHTCGSYASSETAAWVVQAVTTSEPGCISPDTGWTYRGLSTHGGFIGTNSWSLDHWPLITAGVVQ